MTGTKQTEDEAPCSGKIHTRSEEECMVLTELNSRNESFVNITLSRGDTHSPMDGDDLQPRGRSSWNFGGGRRPYVTEGTELIQHN